MHVGWTTVNETVREIISNKTIYSFDGDALDTQSFTSQMLAYAADKVVQLMKMPKFMISPITMGTTFLKSLWHDKVFKLILTILACQQ